MIPDDDRHGTEAGYEQHIRDNEDPCDACQHGKNIAARRRSKRKKMGHVYTLPLGNLHQRLTNWRDAGATYGDIADHIGIEESRVWELLNDTPPTVYARTYLAIEHAPNHTPITALGITRRIQALHWLGYSVAAIAAEAGCHNDTVLDARDQPRQFIARKVRAGIVAAYDRLHMTIPNGDTQQHRAGITRARNLARRNGWGSPMSWRDIDDRRERPELDRDRWDESLLDHAVVDRVLSGDRKPRRLTNAEAAEIVRRALARGQSTYDIERLYGLKSDRYRRGAA